MKITFVITRPLKLCHIFSFNCHLQLLKCHGTHVISSNFTSILFFSEIYINPVWCNMSRTTLVSLTRTQTLCGSKLIVNHTENKNCTEVQMQKKDNFNSNQYICYSIFIQKSLKVTNYKSNEYKRLTFFSVASKGWLVVNALLTFENL